MNCTYDATDEFSAMRLTGPTDTISGFQPLSCAEADRILQNVLRACGYPEAHISLPAFTVSEDYTIEQVL